MTQTDLGRAAVKLAHAEGTYDDSNRRVLRARTELEEALAYQADSELKMKAARRQLLGQAEVETSGKRPEA